MDNERVSEFSDSSSAIDRAIEAAFKNQSANLMNETSGINRESVSMDMGNLNVLDRRMCKNQAQ